MSQVYTFCRDKNQSQPMSKTSTVQQSSTASESHSFQERHTPPMSKKETSRPIYSYNNDKSKESNDAKHEFTESNFPTLGGSESKPKSIGCWGNPLKLDVVKEAFINQPIAPIQNTTTLFTTVKKSVKPIYMDEFDEFDEFGEYDECEGFTNNGDSDNESN